MTTKELPVSVGAKLLDINRTSIYYKGTPVSEAELACKEIIVHLHTDNPAWGARQMSAQLKAHGYHVGRRKTGCYMNEMDEIQHNKAAMENSDDETDNTGHDYYADENYDTDGNATLIKHEKIIYDSEEMQFIAVTTKDGNVFYILINYSAEGDEDNVFFLNKVDDFDLYSLLYAGNEGEEEKDPAEQAKKYADAATNGGVTVDVSDHAEKTTGETNSAEEKSTTKQPSSMNSNALILVGVGVLAVIGGAVLVLKKGKFGKKKNTSAEDFEEDYDDDYGSVTDEDDEA